MKNILTLTFILALSTPLLAQQNGPRHADKQKRPEITEIVKDLNANQKRDIQAITKESRTRIDALRAQQQTVRDSIHLFIDREGNQSRILFPLFDREANIQREISRTMYTTKVRIDEVLTKEQRQTLRNANDNHPRREGNKHKK